jgi:hypothetical protein
MKLSMKGTGCILSLGDIFIVFDHLKGCLLSLTLLVIMPYCIMLFLKCFECLYCTSVFLFGSREKLWKARVVEWSESK